MVINLESRGHFSEVLALECSVLVLVLRNRS